MRDRTRELYALERLSGRATVIHRLNASAKLLATLIFLITVVSFDRYAFGRLVPYIFYPTLLMALSETPYSMLLKRFLIALPFCLFAGIANVVFDKEAAFVFCGLTVSYGVVSLFTVLLRAYLCVMAVLTLVAVTPLSQLTGAMRLIRIPHVFVTIFEMTYRYIGVLLEEVLSMHTAYMLRGAGSKGIAMRDMGGFVGVLLLRSIDRADRVYNAMKCRGYAYNGFTLCGDKPTRADFIFLAVTCALCLTFRFIDISPLFIEALGGRL